VFKHLGIYGAGQLGAFLCQAARKLDLETTVIAAQADDTATSFADHVIIAPLDDMQATHELLAACDVVTFELEAVPPDVLRELERQNAAGKVRVAPAAKDLLLIQNKHSQKCWLQDQGFPTAPFIDCSSDVTAAEAAEQVGLPFVQKTHRGGYDGRGVQIVRDTGASTPFWPGATIAEQFIEPKREVAVLVARSSVGELALYPALEMEFDPVGNLVRYVVAPAPLSSDIAQQAARLSADVVVAMNGVGLFAVELFVTPQGQVLVNEIAPRVHNSGHLTIEANATSQYEQHIRAIVGLPLGSTEQLKPACMVNILNEPDLAGAVPLAEPGMKRLNSSTYLHWYGKAPTKPLRKMGHMTCLAETLDLARAQCDDAMASLAAQKGELA
jgi:5-(carboxyamino)imidazole ribonucleotide synthase